MKDSNAHTPLELAAVRWWRKRHPEHKSARLQVVRHDGTVFSHIVAPKSPGVFYRENVYSRIVESLDNIVEQYRPVRDATLARLSREQQAANRFTAITEADIEKAVQ